MHCHRAPLVQVPIAGLFRDRAPGVAVVAENDDVAGLLRQGAYLMSWALPSGTVDPGWSRYRAIAERTERPEEGMPEIRRFMIADASGQANSLPAVMLTVDYAEGATV